MNLKKILKTVKLHENQISMALGAFILLVAAIFVIKYIKNIQTERNQTNQTQNQNETIHTIEKGETLWSISEKYFNNGTDWKKIAEANNISSPTKLEVGQQLTIPTGEKETTATEAPKETELASPAPKGQITEEAASTTNAITGANYTVVKGDSLWKIAVRAYGDGYKWSEIAKENHLTHPNVIHTGNVLILPR
ncbi:MAG TPA: LysM peptidoglycan-binding domain-containing protein [Candidatus Saccharimonadales bacterium]|nr:LysM peptidoglycan-binding domain-containing protein [Candidatus Saccharimonadales bacterium]